MKVCRAVFLPEGSREKSTSSVIQGVGQIQCLVFVVVGMRFLLFGCPLIRSQSLLLEAACISSFVFLLALSSEAGLVSLTPAASLTSAASLIDQRKFSSFKGFLLLDLAPQDNPV